MARRRPSSAAGASQQYDTEERRPGAPPPSELSSLSGTRGKRSRPTDETDCGRNRREWADREEMAPQKAARGHVQEQQPRRSKRLSGKEQPVPNVEREEDVESPAAAVELKFESTEGKNGGAGMDVSGDDSQESGSSASDARSEHSYPPRFDMDQGSAASSELPTQPAVDLEAQALAGLEIIERKDPSYGLYSETYGNGYQTWLCEQEIKYRPNNYFSTLQRDLRPSMRHTLIDWIVEVSREYKLQFSTLFLIVELVDRCLSTFHVQRTSLQLLGVACILVAAKLEEEHPPGVAALVYISDSTYTAEQVVDMELQVAQELGFRLFCVTPQHFAVRYCNGAGCDPRQACLALYLMELGMQDYSLVTLLPSIKAASAVLLARMTMCSREQTAWSTSAEAITGYTMNQLEPCVRRMRDLHEAAESSKLAAVRNKYLLPAKHSVGLLTVLRETELNFE